MTNPACTKTIKGVLHLSRSEQHYQLDRAYPSGKLVEAIEQYWLVTWDLRGQTSHTQKNLPDPCVSLFFDKQGAKLLGPISKNYTYEMSGQGHVFGIKFKSAGFSSYTSQPLSELAERYSNPKTVFSHWDNEALSTLHATTSLDHAITIAEPLLLQCLGPVTEKQRLTNTIVDFIKQSPHIMQVNQIATHFGINVRTLQRLFERYVGLNPKWVIRKYRLHEVLQNAEISKPDWLEISLSLGYTDQPHFIKDFKDMIGVTPTAYLK